MDFGLRDWLLILGPLFVAGVLLHGYWRMRSNRNTLKMSLDKSFMSRPGESTHPEEDLSMLKAELPNGGARVKKIPEQSKLDLDELNLDENVPVLMEPVEMGRSRDELEEEAYQEAPREEQVIIPAEDRAPVEHEHDVPIRVESDAARAARQAPPEYYIVLYVTALDRPFNGQALLETLVDMDMQYGEMNIFHRMLDGDSVFSLVNAVEPGTFDINAMSELETPAVSLFMRVHELDEPLAVFNQMIEVAQTLAEELGGEVKDDRRSVVTPQTILHWREAISEYELKHH